MIKIERKRTDKAQKAIISLQEAKRTKGTYNTPEVNAAEELVFEPIVLREETMNTQKLFQEIHCGSTPQKKMEAKILRKTLRKELSKFILRTG